MMTLTNQMRNSCVIQRIITMTGCTTEHRLIETGLNSVEDYIIKELVDDGIPLDEAHEIIEKDCKTDSHGVVTLREKSPCDDLCITYSVFKPTEDLVEMLKRHLES